MFHRYEKLDENYKMKYCPAHDYDGSVTGHIVINVKAWFDENPEERKRLGWIKHLYYESNEELLSDLPDWDPVIINGKTEKTQRIDMNKIVNFLPLYYRKLTRNIDLMDIINLPKWLEMRLAGYSQTI